MKRTGEEWERYLVVNRQREKDPEGDPMLAEIIEAVVRQWPQVVERVVLADWLATWCDVMAKHWGAFHSTPPDSAAWHEHAQVCLRHLSKFAAALAVLKRAEENPECHAHPQDIKLPPVRRGRKLDMIRLQQRFIMSHLSKPFSDIVEPPDGKRGKFNATAAFNTMASGLRALPHPNPAWSPDALKKLARKKKWNPGLYMDNSRRESVLKLFRILEPPFRETLFEEIVQFVASYFVQCGFTSWIDVPETFQRVDAARHRRKTFKVQVEKEKLQRRIHALKTGFKS